jgi:fructose-1,6-bisphosphatase/inositol monophosphatase family enzyme
MLASGHVDLVIETGLKPYDVLALVPIIAGAGGIIHHLGERLARRRRPVSSPRATAACMPRRWRCSKLSEIEGGQKPQNHLPG